MDILPIQVTGSSALEAINQVVHLLETRIGFTDQCKLQT